MSLTVTVKDELARVVPGPMPQRRAEVASMLRFAGGLHIVSGQIVVEAELDHGGAVRRLHRELKDLYSLEPEVMVVRGGSLHRGSRYVLRVSERGRDLARLAGLVDAHGRPVRGMPVAVVQGGRAAAAAAWRGAFLARGSLTEPGRSSSLEITCPGSEAALALVGAARRFDIAAKAREVRGADRVVVRDGEAIGVLLEKMGAVEAYRVWGERRSRRETRERPTAWLTSTTPTCAARPVRPWPPGRGWSVPSRSWATTSPSTWSRPAGCAWSTSRRAWRSWASSLSPS